MVLVTARRLSRSTARQNHGRPRKLVRTRWPTFPDIARIGLGCRRGHLLLQRRAEYRPMTVCQDHFLRRGILEHVAFGHVPVIFDPRRIVGQVWIRQRCIAHAGFDLRTRLGELEPADWPAGRSSMLLDVIWPVSVGIGWIR